MSITLDRTAPLSSPLQFDGAYTQANQYMARMHQQLLVRTAAQRRRRYVVGLLDIAIDQCERRNLSAPDQMRGRPDLRAPKQAATLIERLQLELYGESRTPQSNQQALDILFGLQRAFMPYCDDDDRAEVGK